MTGRDNARNLVLVGFMGTGKSLIGRLCAAQMQRPFCDSDAVIEQQAGCSVRELFAVQGEAHFRERERQVIAELASTPGLVIATGGGAALNSQNVNALRETGLVVLLTATPNVLLKRVGNARSRPLLADAPDPRARIETLLNQRLPHYRAAAHCQVDTSGNAPHDVVNRILMLYELTSRGNEQI